jgi:hypothetical protein
VALLLDVIHRENVLVISTFHGFPPATSCDEPIPILNRSSPAKVPTVENHTRSVR